MIGKRLTELTRSKPHSETAFDHLRQTPGSASIDGSPSRVIDALAWASIVLLGVVGWLLGVQATKVPSVERVGLFDYVQFFAAVDAPPADFRWSQDPDGSIDIYISLRTDHPGYRPYTFVGRRKYTVELSCEARMALTLDGPYDEWIRQTSSGSSGENCTDTPQVVTVDLPPGEDLVVLHGRPAEGWTDESAGRRVARAPRVVLGDTDDEVMIDGGRLRGLHAPAVGSTVQAELTGSTGESLDSYLPAESYEQVSVTTSVTPIVIGSTRQGTSVSWEAVKDAEDEFVAVEQGSASWSSTSGTARAQRFLLLSGVLLGVCASSVVERLFFASRRASAGG